MVVTTSTSITPIGPTPRSPVHRGPAPITRRESCTQTREFCTQAREFCTQAREFCAQARESCAPAREFCAQACKERPFALATALSDVDGRHDRVRLGRRSLPVAACGG